MTPDQRQLAQEVFAVQRERFNYCLERVALFICTLAALELWAAVCFPAAFAAQAAHSMFTLLYCLAAWVLFLAWRPAHEAKLAMLATAP